MGVEDRGNVGEPTWDEVAEEEGQEIDPFDGGDCGMTPDGYCMKAGSEECDWECPYNN